MQVLQGRDSPFITQVLLLTIIDHGRFQSRPKYAPPFQARRRLFALLVPTARADHRVLLHFNHLGWRGRQFRNLMRMHQAAGGVEQLGLAVGTAPGFDDDGMIGLSDPWAFILHMPVRRSVPPPAGFNGSVAFLIARGWLRGVARSRRRLLSFFKFQLQGRILSLQLRHDPGQRGQLLGLGQHQPDQFVVTQLPQVAFGHLKFILADLSVLRHLVSRYHSRNIE